MIGLALGTTDGVVDGVLTLGLMMAHLIEKTLEQYIVLFWVSKNGSTDGNGTGKN